MCCGWFLFSIICHVYVTVEKCLVYGVDGEGRRPPRIGSGCDIRGSGRRMSARSPIAVVSEPLREHNTHITSLTYIRTFMHQYMTCTYITFELIIQESDIGDCRSRWRPIFIMTILCLSAWRVSSRRTGMDVQLGPIRIHHPCHNTRFHLVSSGTSR